MIRTTRRTALALAAAGLLATLMPAAQAAQGTASGTLTVNGKTVSVAHAYARAVPGFSDPSTTDTRVIVSDVPLDAAALADDFARIALAKAGKLHAFEITIDASGAVVSTAWRHDGFKGAMPSGVNSDDVFTKTALDGAVVAGSYKSAAPEEFFDNTFSFDVTFQAPIAH